MSHRFRSIAVLPALLAGVAACDGGDRKVTCSSSCSSRDFEIEGESGVSTFQVTCHTSFDYPAGSQRVTSESCTGTRTYMQSGRAYHFTSDWDQVTCRLKVHVDEVGDCTAP